MAYIGFKASDVEPREDFTPMPVNWYSMEIIESELKQNSKKTGEILVLVWQVTQGEFKGRRVIQNLNISHESEKAQSIAHRELADICEAVGVEMVEDSEQLHFKDAAVRITIQRGDKGDYNGVGKVKALDGDIDQRPRNERQGRRETRAETRPPQAERQPETNRGTGGKTGPWSGRR